VVSSVVKYWFCILTPENYEIVKNELVWGVTSRHKNKIIRVEPGDRLVMYVTGERKIKGIYEAVSKPYEDETKIFHGGVYPYRVKLRQVKESEKGIDIRELVPELKLFKRKDAKWAGVLRGRAMIEITEKDYKTIENRLG